MKTKLMAKKKKIYKVQFKEGDKYIEDEKQFEVKSLLESTDLARVDSITTESMVTTTISTKSMSGRPRSVYAMHKLLVKKSQGKKLKALYNNLGIPIGDT